MDQKNEKQSEVKEKTVEQVERVEQSAGGEAESNVLFRKEVNVRIAQKTYHLEKLEADVCEYNGVKYSLIEQGETNIVADYDSGIILFVGKDKKECDDTIKRAINNGTYQKIVAEEMKSVKDVRISELLRENEIMTAYRDKVNE